MEYPEVVKARMVRKMTGPEAWSATALAEETGIPQPTLSRWVREAGRVTGMSQAKKSSRDRVAPPTPPGPDTTAPAARRPQDLSPLERAKVVVEASELGDDAVGEFLRHRGLHAEHLAQWRAALEAALTSTPRRESQRVRELERELARKDKALAETTALIVLKKKLALLFGEAEDGDTRPRSGR
jgi:transposase-like protein